MSERAFSRTDRLGPELQRLLPVLLRQEVKDPRLDDLTIQEVRVTRDLAHAKVFFTVLGIEDEEEARAQEKLLNGPLAGYIRHLVAGQVQWRTVPELTFVYDTSIAQGENLSALIDHAVSEESHPGDDAEPGTSPETGHGAKK